MTDQIQQELLKLEQELLKFKGSVNQIIKASEQTDNLIEASKNLQNSFAQYLENIKGLFSEYMTKTYNFTEKNLSKLYEQFQERIKHEDNTLQQLSQLTIQNETLTKEYISQVHQAAKATLEEFAKNSLDILNEQKEYLKLQIEKNTIDTLKKYSETQQSINTLIENHNNRLKTEQEILDKYLELAEETAKLIETIKNIDFPKHLSKLHNELENQKTILSALRKDTNEIITNNNDIKTTLKNIESNPLPQKIFANTEKILSDPRPNIITEITKNILKRTGSIRFWIIFLLLINIVGFGFTLFILFSLYPQIVNTLLNLFK